MVESLGPLPGPGASAAKAAIEAAHEVVIVDPTRVAQLGLGQHKRKSDRIDAEKVGSRGGGTHTLAHGR